MNELIAGKEKNIWTKELPLLKNILNYDEIIWINSERASLNKKQKKIVEKITAAENRLKRFKPYIKKVYPKLEKGIIESPLKEINKTKQSIEKIYSQKINGNLYLKCDYKLPIAGSIKARGGIYEVLKHAEKLALQHKLLNKEDNYAKLADNDYKKFFSRYKIAVGSTGNLGLSIGIMSSQLGFKAIVHMSADAKEWKKKLLRSRGVKVIEYRTDYSKAVKEGRKKSEAEENTYFIDDENSIDLFMGYAVAARRLKKQLKEINVKINKNNQLFVYLPCGVGGGPGGITYGLKSIYGENVHCFFVEPTHAPSMLLGLMTGEHNNISVQDFGIDNITEADGLAVGKPSGFIGKEFGNLIDGILTVEDKRLFRFLKALKEKEKIFMEPSAQAGFIGPLKLFETSIGNNYVKSTGTTSITHIVWGTGGSLMPEEIKRKYYKKANMY